MWRGDVDIDALGPYGFGVRGRGWMLGVTMALGCLPVGAHQELYHNMEVDLRETEKSGVARISMTVHAPELLVGFADAADAFFDARWLETRSDGDLEEIVGLARQYLTERFAMRLEGGDPAPVWEEATFDDYEAIRSGRKRQLPPACLVATRQLAVPAEGGALRVEHSADSEKRLMLVVSRPGSFPAVMDVEAGSSVVVPLLERPVPEVIVAENEEGAVLWDKVILTASLVLIGSLLLGWLVARAREGSQGE